MLNKKLFYFFDYLTFVNHRFTFFYGYNHNIIAYKSVVHCLFKKYVKIKKRIKGGMKMKAAVLFKDGFEELEALSVVDVLRRAQLTCLMVGMDAMSVKSSHGIEVKMDQLFDESVYDVDIVVLPGGLPGATSLRDDQRVIDILKSFNEQGKWIEPFVQGLFH